MDRKFSRSQPPLTRTGEMKNRMSVRGCGIYCQVMDLVVETAATEIIVRISGELDAAQCPEFETRMRAAMDSELPVRIDATGVTFIDSSALNVLLNIRRIGSLIVNRGNPRIDRLLALTGLEILYGDQV